MKSNQRYITSVSLIVALGGFLMGFDASVISGVVKFIEPHFDLSKIQLGWAVGCLTFSATIAMLMSGPLSDYFGRRRILMYAAVLYAVSAILSALAPSFIMLVIARMIGGFGVGASLIIAPMYIAEISPPAMRGKMVSFNQLNIVIGISTAFFSNYLILRLGDSGSTWTKNLGLDVYNWRWMLGLETLPALLYFLFLFVVPESPRWLIMKGLEEKARQVFLRANGEEKTMEVIRDVKQSLTEDKSKEKVKLGELFHPALKLVLIIGFFIAITQQITGINAVFFYAPLIFEQTGIGTDASFSQAILVGLTNLLFTIIAMGLIDRIGRKPLLILGVSGIVLSMFLLASTFNSATYSLDKEGMAFLAGKEVNTEKLIPLENTVFESDIEFKEALITQLGGEDAREHESVIISQAIHMNSLLVLLGIIAFVASFAVSLGPVMWVLFSELFPNKVRGLAISFAGFINSAVSFTVQLVFPWELANLGNAVTFLIYGIFAVLGLIFIIIIIPETKGKSLEELEKSLVRTHK